MCNALKGINSVYCTVIYRNERGKKSMIRNEDGQTMAEYGIILSVVACVAIAGFTLIGSSVNDKANTVASNLK